MASPHTLTQSFHSSDHDLSLAPSSHAAFSSSSSIPNIHHALQYSSTASSPQSHITPHMSSHFVNHIHHILDCPSTYNNMISSLQLEDSSMLLSDLATMPPSSDLSPPVDFMGCDLWSLVDAEPSLQLDVIHKPNYVSHTQNEAPFQHDLQLPPPPSPPMDTILANSTHCPPTEDDTRSSPAPNLKEPSEIISKPFTLSSSSLGKEELQRRIHLKPVCSIDGGLKGDAEKVDHIALRMSNNLISERRRRKKYNDKLYSLRALIPKISKLDKASIVNDAIEHVQDLQKQVTLRQKEISSLESRLSTGGRGTSSTGRHGRVSRRPVYPQHKVSKMDIVTMEEGTYQLRIECAKGEWVAVQLTRALEALHFDILRANLTTIGDCFLNTLVLQGKIVKSKDLREMMLDILPKFGLIFR